MRCEQAISYSFKQLKATLSHLVDLCSLHQRVVFREALPADLLGVEQALVCLRQPVCPAEDVLAFAFEAREPDLQQ